MADANCQHLTANCYLEGVFICLYVCMSINKKLIITVI